MAFHRGKRGVATAAVALAALAAGGGVARGQALGEASGYTEFILNNSTRNGDTTGAVAVGGNADFKTNGSFSVDNYAQVSNFLVVGGALTGQYSTIGQSSHGGNIYVGGNLNYNDPTFFGNTFVKGDVNLSGYGTITGNLTHQGAYSNPNTTITGPVSMASVTLPIHFSTDQTMLTSLSTAQYKASDPVVTYAGGGGNQLNFAASGAGTSYFNVSGSDLAGALGLHITGTADETVVINVSGTSDTMPNTGYTLTGITADHVLFNFYQATSLAILGGKGSVLAPFASATFSGSLDGEIIAYNLTGGGESHVYEGGGGPGSGHLTPFDGTLRPVPEPASLALLGLGGLGLAGRAWRRRAGRRLPIA